jgi:hypothetical protein
VIQYAHNPPGDSISGPTPTRKGGCPFFRRENRLLSDAFTDRFDVALLISADSDLVGPIQRVRHLFPDKRVIVVFPPARHSNALKNIAHACLHLDRATLVKSVFPDQVVKPDGFVLHRPAEWR